MAAKGNSNTPNQASTPYHESKTPTKNTHQKHSKSNATVKDHHTKNQTAKTDGKNNKRYTNEQQDGVTLSDINHTATKPQTADNEQQQGDEQQEQQQEDEQQDQQQQKGDPENDSNDDMEEGELRTEEGVPLDASNVMGITDAELLAAIKRTKRHHSDNNENENVNNKNDKNAPFTPDRETSFEQSRAEALDDWNRMNQNRRFRIGLLLSILLAMIEIGVISLCIVLLIHSNIHKNPYEDLTKNKE